MCTIVLPNQNGGLSLSIDQSADQVRDQTVRTLVAAVVGTGSDAAQQAVTAVILGSSRLAGRPDRSGGQRFAVLPASTRHAWLIAHAADLRAGRITLEQLP